MPAYYLNAISIQTTGKVLYQNVIVPENAENVYLE